MYEENRKKLAEIYNLLYDKDLVSACDEKVSFRVFKENRLSLNI